MASWQRLARRQGNGLGPRSWPRQDAGEDYWPRSEGVCLLLSCQCNNVSRAAFLSHLNHYPSKTDWLDLTWFLYFLNNWVERERRKKSRGLIVEHFCTVTMRSWFFNGIITIKREFLKANACKICGNCFFYFLSLNICLSWAASIIVLSQRSVRNRGWLLNSGKYFCFL